MDKRENDRYRVLREVKEFLGNEEKGRVYSVKFARSYISNFINNLLKTYGVGELPDELTGSMQELEPLAPLLRKLRSKLVENDESVKTLDIELNIGDMDVFNSMFASVIDDYYSSHESVVPVFSRLSLDEIEELKDRKLDRIPVPYVYIYKQMHDLNQAFMDAGGPIRPGYKEYFEVPNHDS